MIVRVDEIVNEYCCDAPRFETVSVTDTKTVPLNPPDGVPPITPPELIESPAGSPEAVHRKLPEPPLADIDTGP